MIQLYLIHRHLIHISKQEIHISMQEDTFLVCRKTGKTGEDSNAA